jgi:hypothetical protein
LHQFTPSSEIVQKWHDGGIACVPPEFVLVDGHFPRILRFGSHKNGNLSHVDDGIVHVLLAHYNKKAS